MSKKILFVLIFLFAGFPSVRVTTQNMDASQFDLLITNARVVDGAGNPWFRADVAVKNGKIARIGRIDPKSANQTIDAQNKILAPGFIDVHGHVEGIFNTPEA